jgi:hypothetical protein
MAPSRRKWIEHLARDIRDGNAHEITVERQAAATQAMHGFRLARAILVEQYTTGVPLLFQRPPVILAPVPLKSLAG